MTKEKQTYLADRVNELTYVRDHMDKRMPEESIECQSLRNDLKFVTNTIINILEKILEDDE